MESEKHQTALSKQLLIYIREHLGRKPPTAAPSHPPMFLKNREWHKRHYNCSLFTFLCLDCTFCNMYFLCSATWIIAVQPEVRGTPSTEGKVEPTASEVEGAANFTHLEHRKWIQTYLFELARLEFYTSDFHNCHFTLANGRKYVTFLASSGKDPIAIFIFSSQSLLMELTQKKKNLKTQCLLTSKAGQQTNTIMGNSIFVLLKINFGAYERNEL